jgi:hypothetical protein
MNKYILLLVLFPLSAFALECPVGQEVQSVMITPGTGGTPAVTHEVTHPAVTEEQVIIDTPAYTSCDNVGFPAGDYTNSSCTHTGFSWQEVYKKVNHPAVTHTETVVITPAWTETVIDEPAILGTDPVYEDQCVVDTDYVPPAPPTPEPPKPQGTVMPCLIDNTCPCAFFNNNKEFDACVAQRYPNGVWCELKPTQSCFGQWKDCTPEPVQCKEGGFGSQPTTVIEIQNRIISLSQQVIGLITQLLNR